VCETVASENLQSLYCLAKAYGKHTLDTHRNYIKRIKTCHSFFVCFFLFSGDRTRGAAEEISSLRLFPFHGNESTCLDFSHNTHTARRLHLLWKCCSAIQPISIYTVCGSSLLNLTSLSHFPRHALGIYILLTFL